MGKPNRLQQYLGLNAKEITFLAWSGLFVCIAIIGLLFLVLYSQTRQRRLATSALGAGTPFGIILPPTWTSEPTNTVTPTKRPTRTPTSTPIPVTDTAPPPTEALSVENSSPSIQQPLALNSQNYPEMYGPSYLFGDIEGYRNKRFSIKQYVVKIQDVRVGGEAQWVLFLGTKRASQSRGVPIVVIGLKPDYPYRTLEVNNIITVYGYGQGVIEIKEFPGRTYTAPLMFGEGYFKNK